MLGDDLPAVEARVGEHALVKLLAALLCLEMGEFLPHVVLRCSVVATIVDGI
jgi:hypothetical protein